MESTTIITAKKLAADGPPVDNWYLHVTDYKIIDPRALCLTGSTAELVGADLADAKDRLEAYVFPKDGSASERTIKLFNLNIEDRADVERFLAQDSMDVVVADPVTLHEYSPNDKVISLQVVDGVHKGGVNVSLGLAVVFLVCGAIFVGLAKVNRDDVA
jgi:hypothetical protein